MATLPTVELEIRKPDARLRLLNKVGGWLNRILPAWMLARLWSRWLGWVPIMRWRLKGEGDWRIITMRDVIEKHLSGDTQRAEVDN